MARRGRPTKWGEGLVSFSLRLPPAQMEYLDARADETGATVAELLRRIVAEEMARRPAKAE
jgi:predicted DNA-binding protein